MVLPLLGYNVIFFLENLLYVKNDVLLVKLNGETCQTICETSVRNFWITNVSYAITPFILVSITRHKHYVQPLTLKTLN